MKSIAELIEEIKQLRKEITYYNHYIKGNAFSESCYCSILKNKVREKQVKLRNAEKLLNAIKVL